MTQQITYALRIFAKYRLYTGISIIGLGIAISSFWFIANFVNKSHQYDAFHQNHDRIYRLTMEVSTGSSTDHYAATGKPAGNVLVNNYSGIEAYANMTFHRDATVKVENDLFNETGFFSINPETFEVFTFDFISGNKTTFSSDPNAVLLSKSLALKYFNSTDVVGEQITIYKANHTVKGVFEDWPENSHLDVKALLNSEAVSHTSGYEPQDWFDLEHYNYVLVDKGTSKKDLEAKLAQLTNEQLKPILEGSGISAELQAQPLKGLYFETGLIDDVAKGNLTYVNAIAATGLIVLLIAGLNFINLSLTQSTKRLKEISIKRILGITRKQLIIQNVTESILMSLLVLFTSGILIYLLDGLYFQYTGFHAVNLADNWLLFCIICLVLFVLGIIGTSYTGVEFSFSNTFKNAVPVNTFKKVLLAFQFALASIVIIATLTMQKQISFMKNKELGFSKEQVLIINLPDSEALKSKYLQFREQVKTFASVENTSLIGGGALPGEENGKEVFEISIDGNKQEKVYNFYRVDENYFYLLDIDFALGRDFKAERPGDQTHRVIINETLATTLNWENPIGKTIWYADQPRSVIGVVKNFHNKSLHNIIEPIVFMYDMNYSTKLLVKTSPAEAETIAALWKTNFPDTPFITSYFDGFLDVKYAKEDHLALLFGVFSMVSLILSCMGLFAIFSLNILHKTKEISIRKILGASVINLFKTATKSYFVLTLASISLAMPISWFVMTYWLDEFAYKIQMDAFIFIFSAALVLIGSTITILYHVVKAINVNPAETLKCE